MAKRKLTRQQQWRIEKIQQERKDRANKRSAKGEDLLQSGELGPEQPGQVIAHYGVQVDVESTDGHVQRCHVRSNIKQLVTGDRVVFCAGEPTGVIVACAERHSVLQRPDPYGKLKPVAANIDYIIVVLAPHPEPHANLLDRYLVAAEASGIKPMILVNKSDQIEDMADFLAMHSLDVYKTLDYPLYTASTKTQTGLNELKQALKNKTSVFVGQSGVGKSSLVNALLPDADLAVGELSESGKGSHTTTTAKLFHFPDGGDLIDSPGIREFALWHLQPDDLIDYFVEFRPFLGHCKFRDCTHRKEPGCRLRGAVEEGLISQQRLDSYFHILGSLDEVTIR